LIQELSLDDIFDRKINSVNFFKVIKTRYSGNANTGENCSNIIINGMK